MSHLISHGRPTRPSLPSRPSPPSTSPVHTVIRAAIGLTAAGIVGTVAPIFALLALYYASAFWLGTPVDRAGCAVGGSLALLLMGALIVGGWCLTRWGTSSGIGWPSLFIATVGALLLCRSLISVIPANWRGYESTPSLFVVTYVIGLGIGIVCAVLEPSSPSFRAVVIASLSVMAVLAFVLVAPFRDVGAICMTTANRPN